MVLSRELPTSFLEALKVSRQILSANHDLIRKNVIETEAEQIVIGAFRQTHHESLSRSDLLLRVNDRLPEAAGERVIVLSLERAEGKPLQYLLGYSQFLGHEYLVTSAVLIPRPETEVLVSEVIQLLKTLRPFAVMKGIEVGLGSGIISIELLAEFPRLEMYSSEASSAALAVAEQNARNILGDSISRLQLLEPPDFLQVLEPFLQLPEAQAREIEFIISNPPYLDPGNSGEFETQVLKYEPKAALFPQPVATGEVDPLYFYRAIQAQAGQVLKSRGFVFLELATERADEIRGLFDPKIWNTLVIQDLNEKDRVIVAQLKL